MNYTFLKMILLSSIIILDSFLVLWTGAISRRRTAKHLKRFSYDLEMKMRVQNKNSKRTERERFDWFIERIETRVALGWLSERSGEKTSRPTTF